MSASEQTKEDSGLSTENILSKLSDLFGAEVAKAFQDEDITCCSALCDLVGKEADSPIFQKLGLNYGKACRFKDEFKKILPRQVPLSVGKTLVKPTMTDMASFSPELRRLYLSKRKRVGVLASDHWGKKYPKFNTPALKAELANFAAKISEECSLVEAGFNEEGIQQHIKDFFAEQRRYKRRMSDKSSSDETNSSPPPLPSLAKKVKKAIGDQEEALFDKKMDAGDSDVTTYKSDEEEDGKASDKSDAAELSDESISCSQVMPKEIENKCDEKLSLRASTLLIKAVFGMQPDRGQLVKVLKSKFGVQQKHLSSLTHTNVMEVMAKKLIKHNYVAIGKDVQVNSLKKGSFNVTKEIAI